ncbi:hypothetical protein LTR70_000022 [Exophiala xenobiotica]|uniref:Ribonucleases P/MRP subunit Pop8-like domain-containing protein n=1 Tax=Lithohypha guttulata TaxID=1690604 RepID=A0ABR0K4E4_9EURO|nr:hypothetical protein LTR24_006954 [Lithohypha guttulata]KAK5330700.1 hypothetical protein LTR70_000022 [Exophiala xenobiotica]
MAESKFTLRNSSYSYIHLRIADQAANSTSHKQKEQLELDEITVLSHLTSALSQYLGLTGTAIPVDILKVQALEAWIRLPIEDERAVVAALSQWVGKGGVTLRVLGRGSWLGGLQRGIDDAKFWSLER